MERTLGGGHRHLALPAHHLEPFANRFFSLAVERTKIVDIAGKGPGLGRMTQRQTRAGKRLQGADATAALDQASPEILEREAKRTDNSHPGDHDAAVWCGTHGMLPAG